MTQKELHNKLKVLHIGILRTHAKLIKTHEKMVESDKKVSGYTAKGIMSQKDIANYTKARNEAHEAHEKWMEAQVKYFDFIGKNRIAS